MIFYATLFNLLFKFPFKNTICLCNSISNDESDNILSEILQISNNGDENILTLIFRNCSDLGYYLYPPPGAFYQV